MSEIKLSDMQKKVLAVLAAVYLNEENVLFFRGMASRTGLDERQCRLAARALSRKGLCEHTTVCDWEGRVAGSGYECTPAGWSAFAALNSGG